MVCMLIFFAVALFIIYASVLLWMLFKLSSLALVGKRVGKEEFFTVALWPFYRNSETGKDKLEETLEG